MPSEGLPVSRRFVQGAARRVAAAGTVAHIHHQHLQTVLDVGKADIGVIVQRQDLRIGGTVP